MAERYKCPGLSIPELHVRSDYQQLKGTGRLDEYDHFQKDYLFEEILLFEGKIVKPQGGNTIGLLLRQVQQTRLFFP